MRKIIVIILSFFIGIFYLSFFAAIKPVYAEKLPNCTELKGTIDGTSWPNGATIDVACDGQVQPNLKSGDQFDLNQCSCPPYADGCLKVGQNLSLTSPAIGDDGLYHVQVVGDVWKVPNGCTLGDVSGFCSTNYIQPENVPSFTVPISCQQPPPACKSACTDNNNCTGQSEGCTQCLPDTGSTTGKSCQTPATPPSAPSCNTSCSGNPSVCNGAQNGCTACVNGTCQKPPPGSTPVPTSPPAACNTPCSGNPSVCNGAQGGCTACISGTCQKPPPGSTPVPTSPPAPSTPPAACNSACKTSNGDRDCQGAKDGCTVCGSAGKCVPAPTPTPAFNENWCTCDGLDTNPASFFPGDTVSFMSYGKVEAPYLNRAKVESMNFFVYRGDATTATRIADSGPIAAAIESQTAAKNRYKSTWGYTIPKDIKKDEIFRVQSKIKCVAQNVLGASIKYEPTLIDRIVSFIGYIFGFTSQPVAMDYQATPAPSETAMVHTTSSPQVLAAQNSLQIDTFTPAQIIEKSCSIIRFKFGN
jgi:hypothetical protein